MRRLFWETIVLGTIHFKVLWEESLEPRLYNSKTFFCHNPWLVQWPFSFFYPMVGLHIDPNFQQRNSSMFLSWMDWKILGLQTNVALKTCEKKLEQNTKIWEWLGEEMDAFWLSIWLMESPRCIWSMLVANIIHSSM